MNKTACFLLALLYAATPALAQKKNKISLSVYVGTGPSWYGGKSVATSATYYSSIVSLTARTPPAYVDKPYGHKASNYLLAGVRADYWLPASNWNFALSVQIEGTGGKGTIVREIPPTGNSRDVKGEYKISNDYVSINPEIGHAVLIGKIGILLNAGVDYAIHATGRESYTVPDQNGMPYMTGYSGGTGRDDIRLTASMMVPFANKWDLSIGYKHGLVKFPGHNAYLRIIQCKVAYNIIRPKMKNWGTPKF